MTSRRWNWSIWTGFLVCVAGAFSYIFFARFPLTRDVPWVSFLLFLAGLSLLAVGLKRAFTRADQYRGKIFGPILATLSLLLIGFFCFAVLVSTRQLPSSSSAPRLGQKAPDFSMLDTSNHPVSLAALLAAPLPGSGKPAKGVLLVFYRGYW